MKSKKKLYEEFHGTTKPLNRLPERNNFTYKQTFEFIEKHVLIDKKIRYRVLDIGCGAGQISFFLASQQHEVTGIDISKKAIESCLKSKKKFRINNITFKSGDITSIKMKRKFDLVIMSELIEHIENDEKLLTEVRKILSPRGKILITTPSKKAPLYRLGLLKEFDKRVGHIRRYDEKTLLNLIDKSELKVIKIKKNEGVLRNLLYTFRICNIPLRIVNRIGVFGNIVTTIDKMTLRIFGESDYFVLAQKK